MKLAWLGTACAIAASMLIVPWKLVPTDTFMALVCGREIAEHGLPHVDALFVATRGHAWIDQQWLAQLAMYGVAHVMGLRGLLVLQALVMIAVFSLCARHALARGASPPSTLVCALAGFCVGAASFTVRSQMFSLLGFAALLVLASEDANTPSKRVWWSIPILAIWSNVHGAVVLGVMIIVLRGAFDVMAHRARRGIALAALAMCAPFITPYARDLPRYFAEYSRQGTSRPELPVVEWNRVVWPDDWPFFAIFALVLFLVMVVHVKKLVRPSTFETVVLALTGLFAWHATRHLQWFGLAIAAYVPRALDAVRAVREGRVLAMAASAMRVVAPAAVVVLFVRLFVMSTDSLERSYPRGVLSHVETIAREEPDAHVAASDYYADWLLWNVPSLRGRIESDVRFELLDDAQARAMMTFQFAQPGWDTVYPDASVFLVARKKHTALDQKIVTLPGARVAWESNDARLVVR